MTKSRSVMDKVAPPVLRRNWRRVGLDVAVMVLFARWFSCGYILVCFVHCFESAVVFEA